MLSQITFFLNRLPNLVTLINLFINPTTKYPILFSPPIFTFNQHANSSNLHNREVPLSKLHGRIVQTTRATWLRVRHTNELKDAFTPPARFCCPGPNTSESKWWPQHKKKIQKKIMNNLNKDIKKSSSWSPKCFHHLHLLHQLKQTLDCNHNPRRELNENGWTTADFLRPFKCRFVGESEGGRNPPRSVFN